MSWSDDVAVERLQARLPRATISTHRRRTGKPCRVTVRLMGHTSHYDSTTIADASLQAIEAYR